MQATTEKEADVKERKEGRDHRLQILVFIEECEKQGINPSVREIAENAGISPPSTMKHIEKLVALGRLTRTPGTARSLRLVR